MSRSSTSTPPPPFFPAKVSTPSARHASAPNGAGAHFSKHHHHAKKPRKHGFGGSSKPKAPASGLKAEALGLSFEELPDFTVIDKAQQGAPLVRQPSSSSILTFHSAESIPSILTNESGGSSGYNTAPSMSSTVDSSASLSLQTPHNASVVSLPVVVQADSDMSPPPSAHVNSDTPVSAAAGHKGSWTANFGKMAKAVVHTGKSMGMPFGGERKKRDSQSLGASPLPALPAQLPTSAPLPQVPSASRSPACRFAAIPRPTQEELAQLDANAALARKREWAEAEQRRVTECARLCSQWPQSGYNQSKWGPNGAKAYYSPQSLANPDWVAAVMQRQADLEQHLKSNAATYFTCRRDREGSLSDDGSDRSSESYASSQSSPTTSTQFELEQRTIADLKAAMDSTIMVDPTSEQQVHLASQPSQTSLPLDASTGSLRGSRSISELNALSISSIPAKDVQAMDIDLVDGGQMLEPEPEPVRTRHERAQSCGSKRPLKLANEVEEEKRRKVDEAMVVEEAVSSGVIMPSQPAMVDKTGQNRTLSSSTPDLIAAHAAAAQAHGPAMFGHVVKTSDTHPIIISPFFPTDLLSTLAAHLIRQPAGQAKTPMMLGSSVDVPSLLLARTPATPQSLPPSPVRSDLRINTGSKPLGNLLLSSCPGKRLRMEGPVKGRAPVCRDLETDLRRIKNEGVGCLVCCLDDAELALLGVPWETYRAIASKIGLDVIRLPMPDGFTPVSIQMFDSQVELICQNYTLEGINVLVHCRGGVGRAGLTASAWAIKMGFVAPHPSLQLVADASSASRPLPSELRPLPSELEHQMVMSVVERVIAMIRSRRGLKAIESFEQVQFLAIYTAWLRRQVAPTTAA